MMVDVIEIKVQGHRLWLKFDDGAEGEVDFRRALGFKGIFAPLKAPEYFAMAMVEPDIGTVAWPNGTDLNPLVRHAAITGTAVQVA